MNVVISQLTLSNTVSTCEKMFHIVYLLVSYLQLVRKTIFYSGLILGIAGMMVFSSIPMILSESPIGVS